ncbi:CueP family metal-binding protein [Propionibacteriaceae bacterium G1746]|uniref:CueP family metal-binding protein n=1 Tax=Aestuariimicrobium sp. G57 TaxID=3418485 RepID=UPI003C285F98
MRKILPALVAVCLLVLAGCSGASTSTSPAPTATADATVLKRLGFTGKSGEQIVTELDQSANPRPFSFFASVRPDGLLLQDDQGSTVVPLPADKFYLSVAPYENRTHECHFHSLGTCNGELKDLPVQVKITAEDGTVLVDESTTTYAGNGFVGFWIPKGVKGNVTVTTTDGKTGTAPFSSLGTEDATCMTTLKIS